MNKPCFSWHSVAMTMRLTNQIFAFVLLWHSFAYAQEAQEEDFKVAVVDIQKVFKSYYKTADTQKEIDEERARIQKEDGDARLQMTGAKRRVTGIVQKLSNPELTEVERTQLEREREILLQQIRRFDQGRKARYRHNNEALNRQMIGRMRGLLGEIRTLVRQHAEKEGYALVFDRSGTNTNQVPALLYGKDMIDITAVLMQQFNKEEPRE